MKKLKISISIAIYNVPNKYFEKCIQSLILQTYKNFELIIIDDCSNGFNYDKQIKKLTDSGINTKFLKNKKNIGFNKTKDLSRKYMNGDIFFDIDADDYLENEALEKIILLFNEYPDVDFIFFNKALAFSDAYHYEAVWSPNYRLTYDFFIKK
ncbi:MAG: glycosyltransferase [Mycoplasma sp.]